MAKNVSGLVNISTYDTHNEFLTTAYLDEVHSYAEQGETTSLETSSARRKLQTAKSKTRSL
ncbi:unnamed protein product, partial [Trichogramma brassicae]